MRPSSRLPLHQKCNASLPMNGPRAAERQHSFYAMNFVPFEFLDSVAATLRDLPNFAHLDITNEDCRMWKEAVETQRSDRQTLELVLEFGCFKDLFCAFTDGTRLLTFEEVKAMKQEKIQVKDITIRFVTSENCQKVDPPTFGQIVYYIKRLTNLPKLTVGTHASVQAFMVILSRINFYEIAAVSGNCTLPSWFVIDQFRTGCLKKCSACPDGKKKKQFNLALEEYLTTQSFEEVKLPNSFYVSKELYEKLLKTSYVSKKKITFKTNFELPHRCGVVLRRGKTNKRIFIESLGRREERRSYAMTMFSECVSEIPHLSSLKR